MAVFVLSNFFSNRCALFCLYDSFTEPLMIEIKLALDRWCKPESVPTPAPSPARSSLLTESNPGMVHRSKSLNSSRLFSSFLGISASSNSSGSNGAEASGTTLADNSGAVPNSSISSLSLRSTEDALHSVVMGAGTSAPNSLKRPALSKILEETGSSSSHGTPVNSVKVTSRPSLGSRSRSSDDVEAVESTTGRGIVLRTRPIRPLSPGAAAFPESEETSISPSPVTTSAASKSTNYISFLRTSSASNVTGPKKPAQGGAETSPGPTAAHPVLQQSGSTISGSGGTSRKALRAKERTWVYHAVMGVVHNMQQEHSVPIVVFL